MHWRTYYGETGNHACFCVGPQNGEPRCPCMMRGLVQRDGRWIEPEKDLGPINAKLGALYPRADAI